MRRSILLVVPLLVASCARGGGLVDVRFDAGGHRTVIHAEVADEIAEQVRGLMGRAELADDRGMLFVWTDTTAREFHMKDTLIPLDLISIRAGRVVAVQTMQPCEVQDCPITHTPPADAALEVNAGVAARARIEPGTLVASAALP